MHTWILCYMLWENIQDYFQKQLQNCIFNCVFICWCIYFDITQMQLQILNYCFFFSAHANAQWLPNFKGKSQFATVFAMSYELWVCHIAIPFENMSPKTFIFSLKAHKMAIKDAVFHKSFSPSTKIWFTFCWWVNPILKHLESYELFVMKNCRNIFVALKQHCVGVEQIRMHLL